MKAQKLYDLRSKTGFCSANDLNKFFRQVTGGEPSPSGNTEIDSDKAKDFVLAQKQRLLANGLTAKEISDIQL